MRSQIGDQGDGGMEARNQGLRSMYIDIFDLKMTWGRKSENMEHDIEVAGCRFIEIYARAFRCRTDGWKLSGKANNGREAAGLVGIYQRA